VVIYVSGHKTDDDDDNDDEVLVLSSPGIYPDPQGVINPPPAFYATTPNMYTVKGEVIRGIRLH